LVYALNVLKQDKFKKHIKAIYLYGSCARGDQTVRSDVDLFIKVFEDTPQKTLLSMRKEVMSGDLSLPEVELKFSRNDNFSSSEQFNQNIEREGKLLWERM
jgi:predicted nucleotidyltransferase